MCTFALRKTLFSSHFSIHVVSNMQIRQNTTTQPLLSWKCNTRSVHYAPRQTHLLGGPCGASGSIHRRPLPVPFLVQVVQRNDLLAMVAWWQAL